MMDGTGSWSDGLLIHRGGDSAVEVVILDASESEPGSLIERLASSWTAIGPRSERPWVVEARTVETFDRLLQYYDHAPGEDPSHDLAMKEVESIMDMQALAPTYVTIADEEQQTSIRVSTDPPLHHGALGSACAERLNTAGLACSEPPLETDWMYITVSYATGETGREQVLGWDDMYSNEHWFFLEEANRLFVSIRPEAEWLNSGRLETLAAVISRTRVENPGSYNDGLSDAR